MREALTRPDCLELESWRELVLILRTRELFLLSEAGGRELAHCEQGVDEALLADREPMRAGGGVKQSANRDARRRRARGSGPRGASIGGGPRPWCQRGHVARADHADGAENLSERRSGGVARPAVGRGPPKRATLGTKLAAAVPGSRGSLLTERARQREQDAYALWRREAGRRTPACRCAQRGHGRASEMPGVEPHE
ncbi:uncharacterized protein A4U43_C08F14780 [Asparagus officinalis]|nr:uncharacterized protein A4U43_C08F14780 [Asparagus officinalis]